MSKLLALVVTGWLTAVPLPAQVPDALVGLWKAANVPAEFADRTTGAGIALSAWFGQLKLRGDGGYELEEYREGALAGCRVSILQRSRGTARADGDVLSLTPAGGTETLRDGCNAALGGARLRVILPTAAGEKCFDKIPENSLG